MSSSTSSSSWPPLSIATYTESILYECQAMEMMPLLADDEMAQVLPMVQIAALLHQGETIHAHHVYQRYFASTKNNHQQLLLHDWHVVTCCMNDMTSLSQLEKAFTVCKNHAEPFATYAIEVETKFKQRHSVIQDKNLIKPNKNKMKEESNRRPDTTTLISFLETKRWNA